jgi:hypothetical protein
LQFIIARRTPEAPGKGVLFVTPLQGDREIRAAAQAGFNVAQSLHSSQGDADTAIDLLHTV